MIYVTVDPANGRILSASNHNDLGPDSIYLDLESDVASVVRSKYILEGVVLNRPECSVPDNLVFTGDVVVELGVGGKVLCFDTEFVDEGSGALVVVPDGVREFGAVIVPPFPYLTKIVQIKVS